MTRRYLEERFANLSVVRFSYRYHQPPRPLTFAELNHDHAPLVQAWKTKMGMPQGLTA